MRPCSARAVVRINWRQSPSYRIFGKHHRKPLKFPRDNGTFQSWSILVNNRKYPQLKDYGSEGCRFDSCRVHEIRGCKPKFCGLFHAPKASSEFGPKYRSTCSRGWPDLLGGGCASGLGNVLSQAHSRTVFGACKKSRLEIEHATSNPAPGHRRSRKPHVGLNDWSWLLLEMQFQHCPGKSCRDLLSGNMNPAMHEFPASDPDSIGLNAAGKNP